MDIVYVAPTRLADRAAGARHVLDVCRHWAAQGCRVTLFVPRAGAAAAAPQGVRIVRVPAWPAPALARTLSFYLALAFRLAAHLLVHAPAVVYTRFSFLEPLAFLWLKLLFPFFYVGEVNGLRSLETRRGRAAAEAVDAMERLAGRLLDAAFAVTPALRGHLVRRWRLPTDRVAVAPNGVDVETFRPRPAAAAQAQLGLDPARRYIVFVGAMRPWHGLPDLIDGFALLAARRPDARLLLVGDGPARGDAEARVRRLGLERAVRFVGAVEREDAPLWIAAGAFGVAPHRAGFADQTGLAPLKVFEYLACARPALMADVGPGAEFLVRERCGLLYRMGDPAHLAAQMEALLDPRRAAAMGRRGRRFVEQRRAWSRLTRDMIRQIHAWRRA